MFFTFQFKSKKYRHLFWDHWGENSELKKDYNKYFKFDEDIGHLPLWMSKKIREKIKKYDLIHLGDSVTQLYKIAERLDYKISNDDIKLSKILNLGVAGWTTINEFKALDMFFLNGNRAKYVILQVHGNDFGNTPFIHIDEDGSWVAYQIPPPPRILTPWLVSNTHLGKILFDYYLKNQKIVNNYDLQNVSQPLRKIIYLCKKYDVKIHFYFFPHLSKDLIRDVNLINEVFKELKVSESIVTNLGPLYLNTKKELEEFRLIESDIAHPNDLAAELAAQKIYDDLRIRKYFID